MALIRFNDGTPEKTVSAEVGANLWAILTGEVTGDKKQQRFCERVDKLYLNWRNAPDSYIEARKDSIFPMALRQWMVDVTGTPTRPEPRDTFGKAFATKWGLTLYGKLAPSAAEYT